MAHTVSYDKSSDITVVVYSGRISFSEVVKGARETALEAKRSNCARILIDARNVDLLLSTMEIYDLPRELSKVLSEHGLGIHTFKRALLVSKDIHDHHFIETTTRNVGQNARVFSGLAAAQQWLSQ